MSTDVNGLSSQRALLRQQIVRSLIYRTIGAADVAFGTGAHAECYVLNLVAGVHMPANAAFFRDIYKEPLRVLMVMLNSTAHIARIKNAAAATANRRRRAGDAAEPEPMEWRADIRHEYLRNEANTGFVGIRVWTVIEPRALAVAAPAAAPQAIANAPFHDDEADEVDAEEDDEVSNDGMQLEEDHVAHVAEAPPPARVSPDPLSLGLLSTCREATHVRQLMDARASAEARRLTQRGRVLTPEDRQMLAGMRSNTLANLAAWCWTLADTPSGTYFGILRNYFGIGTVAVTQVADLVAAPGTAFLDPRACMVSELGGVAWAVEARAHLYPYDDTFALKHVFTREAAMEYYTEHGVNADQRRLAIYDGGAALPAAAAPQPQQPAEDNHGHRTHRIDAIATRLLNQNNNGTRGVRLWPFPQTTYVLTAPAMVPEVLAIMPFAHAMGDGVPPEVLEHGLSHVVNPADVPTMVWSTLLLAKAEQNLAVDPESLNPLRSFVVSDAAQRVTEADMRTVAQHQKAIVTQALSHEHSEATGCKYRMLLYPTNVRASTHDCMGSLDFIPVERLGRRMNIGPSGTAWEEDALNMFRQVYSAVPVTAADEQDALARIQPLVDILDPDFVERDELLQLRLHHQTERGVLQVKWEKEVVNAPTYEEFKRRLGEYCRESWELALKHAATVDHYMRTSDNIADVLRAKPMRQFFTEHCTDAGTRAVLGAAPEQIMDERPFTQFIQTFLCDIVKSAMHATTQSFSVAILTYLCSLDAHFYAVRRSMPATNVILAGTTGIGKSWVLDLVKALTMPGVILKSSNMTSKALMTETNFDNVVLAFEEGRAGILQANNPVDKQQGTSDTLNMEKGRLTDYQAITTAPHTDDATGRRMTIQSKSSHHNMTIYLTNEALRDMDVNIGRRFIVYFIPRFIGVSEGGDVADQNAISAFVNTNANRTILLRANLVHAGLIMTRSLIKAAVIPEPSRASSEIHWDAVLKHMRVKFRVDSKHAGTFRHYVLQFAANTQNLFANWQELFGPVGHALHAAPDAPAYWSSEALMLHVTPFLQVSKEALIFAATTLEHLYTPFYTEYSLRVLAVKCLNFADVRKWQPRALPGAANTNTFLWDCNYLCLYGRSENDICDQIRANNNEFSLRKEDIRTLLGEFEGVYREECALLSSAPAGDIPRDYPTAGGNDTMAQRHILFFEEDTTRGGGLVVNSLRRGGTQTRLCVSLRFLMEHFDVRMNDSDAIRRLLVENVPVPLTPALDTAIANRANCDVKRSPLARSLHDVLSSKTFEFDPDLDPWINPTTLPPRPFITGFVPAPLTVITSEDGATELTKRTISLHGSFSMLTLKREPGKLPITRENHTRPTETAKRTLAQFSQPGAAMAARALRYGKALGLVAGYCDPDITYASDWLQQLCHPGLPVLEALFYGDDADKGPHPAVLALNAGPVLYRIYRAIDRRQTVRTEENALIPYPLANIRAQVRETVALVNELRVGTFGANYHDIAAVTGNDTWGGLTLNWIDPALRPGAELGSAPAPVTQAVPVVPPQSSMDDDASMGDAPEVDTAPLLPFMDDEPVVDAMDVS
jgi:hypothetical protein